MRSNLSFEQAPPISVPYRFFLTAPWFGVAAGLLLLIEGEGALASRWMPQTLALTHLIVAGFMLQAMCGALLQFLPVAAGANVWRPRLSAGLVYPLTLLGAACLCGGLLWQHAPTLWLAMPLLVLGVGVFVVVTGAALWRTPASGATVACLRLAVAALALTVLIGVVLAGALAHGWALPLAQITAVHLGWGLGGWGLALVAGVSLHVVPMFQMTPAYPPRYARWFAPLLLGLLLLWSVQWWRPESRWAAAAGWGLLGLAAAYAGATITLQMRRKRRITDATYWFFRGAMVCVLAASALWAAAELAGLAHEPRLAMSLGVLLCAGAFVSAINGMLYKIVPFINWLHLQKLGAPPQLYPNMNQMIPARAMRGQLGLHFVAVALVVLAVWWPALSRVAGFVWAASCAWLGVNLLVAARRYRASRDRIRAHTAASAA